jgi:CubicO group peptidase (beta-lactamase class C family)
MEEIGYGYGEWIMLNPVTKQPTGSVTSPGLFGSIPWIDNEKGYTAFLMTFYLNNQGREQRLRELKQLTDQALGYSASISSPGSTGSTNSAGSTRR